MFCSCFFFASCFLSTTVVCDCPKRRPRCPYPVHCSSTPYIYDAPLYVNGSFCLAVLRIIQLKTMDLTSILLFCLMSLVIGAVLMILIQYYAFVKYFNVPEQDSENRSKSLNEKYQLPDVSNDDYYLGYL